MRELAIGDIHGCLHALETLADFVGFDADDKLIMLGDYVDRGPNSKGVVEWVIERTLEGRCVPLRGNHEILMNEALSGRLPMEHWLSCGGRETLRSYAYRGRAPHPHDIPEAHRWFLAKELHPWYETETHIFAHAFVEAALDMSEQPEHSLYWERCDAMAPHVSGKPVIVGHTAQRSGLPLDGGHFVCIDTWAYGDGWLTCLDPSTGQYWQANQRGRSRTAWLQTPPQSSDQAWSYP